MWLILVVVFAQAIEIGVSSLIFMMVDEITFVLQGDLSVVESLRNKFPYNFMYGCVLLSDLYLQ